MINLKKPLKIASFFIFSFVALVSVYLSGCKDNVTSTNEMTDDEYIKSVVNTGYSSLREEDDLMSTEIYDMNDDGAVPPGDTPIDSLIRWGRKITGVNVNINIQSQGDTIKNVTITRTINGIYIIIGIVNGQQDSITKPYVEEMKRLAVFKRVNRTPYPRKNWRLYQVSMLDGETTQPQVGTQYVEMNKIEAYINGTLTYTFLGPDFTQNIFTTKRFDPNAGIPEVQVGDQVRVIVYLYSTQPEQDFVAWHCARNAFGFHREPFAMTSNMPNGSGWDRTYEKTATVYADGPLKRFNGYINASTHKSLYDDSPAEFASDEAGIPYKVKP